MVYVLITRWDSLREEARKEGKRWPWPETRDGLLEWFLRAAREENITMISEWQTLESLVSARRRRPELDPS